MAERYFGRGGVLLGDGSEGPHEAGYLVLDSGKARSELGYYPRWRLQETVRRTMEWYRKLDDGTSARELCLADIRDFIHAGRRDMQWRAAG